MKIRTISADELKLKHDKNEILLIDVRQPAEHRSESIIGDTLLPLCDCSLDKLPSTQKPIVIYCRSGNRSAQACARLASRNPGLNIASLEGGIVAWMQAGYPVKKSNSTTLPIDRQTQIAVGLIGLTGTILGTFANNLFYILPGMIGAGLIFAGITGWCGMAKLLAKMPWNQ